MIHSRLISFTHQRQTRPPAGHNHEKNLAFLQNTAQFTAFLLIAISIMACSPTENNKESANPQVTFKTTEGDFTLELYPDKAPKTVENFLA